MRELHPIEEHLFGDILDNVRAKAMAEGIVIGEEKARELSRDIAVSFMRSNGMSDEQIEKFKKIFVQSYAVQTISEEIARGEIRGEERGQELTKIAAIDFMRSNGMTKEQIERFKKLLSKPVSRLRVKI